MLAQRTWHKGRCSSSVPVSCGEAQALLTRCLPRCRFPRFQRQMQRPKLCRSRVCRVAGSPYRHYAAREGVAWELPPQLLGSRVAADCQDRREQAGVGQRRQRHSTGGSKLGRS